MDEDELVTVGLVFVTVWQNASKPIPINSKPAAHDVVTSAEDVDVGVLTAVVVGVVVVADAD